MWCSICAAVGSRIQLDYMAWWLFSTSMSTAAFSQQPSSALYLCIWISRHLWICQSPFADSFLCIGHHCSQLLQVMLFSFSLVRLKQNLFSPTSLEWLLIRLSICIYVFWVSLQFVLLVDPCKPFKPICLFCATSCHCFDDGHFSSSRSS